MNCSFCNHEFDPDRAEIACSGCLLVGDCHLICCPRCGYQMPPAAVLLRWLKKMRRRQSISEEKK